MDDGEELPMVLRSEAKRNEVGSLRAEDVTFSVQIGTFLQSFAYAHGLGAPLANASS